MPETLGSYQLLRKIAQGGMAEVFVAQRAGEVGGFVQQVAIKRIFPHLVDDPEIIDMFIDEARIASRLHHPNIVQVYDLDKDGRYIFIAMEFVDGCDLRTLCERGLSEDNFVPRELAVRIVSDAAVGLHFAHTAVDDVGRPMNVIHRDVSPQNILISRDGSVKVCDFGIAKAEARITHTRAGQIKGKFSYMSPEQAVGDGRALDHRSDIFALGIILYEITAVTRLFRGKADYETIKRIAEDPITPPSELRPDYPKDLERIVLKALERDPDARYQTAEQLHMDLEDWLLEHRARANNVHLARYMRKILPEGHRHADIDGSGAMAVAEVAEAASKSSAVSGVSESVKQEVEPTTGPMLAALHEQDAGPTAPLVITKETVPEAFADDNAPGEVTSDLDMETFRSALVGDSPGPVLISAFDGAVQEADRGLQWTPVQGRPVIKRDEAKASVQPRVAFASRPSIKERSPEEIEEDEQGFVPDELDEDVEIRVARSASVDLGSIRPTARKPAPRRSTRTESSSARAATREETGHAAVEEDEFVPGGPPGLRPPPAARRRPESDDEGDETAKRDRASVDFSEYDDDDYNPGGGSGKIIAGVLVLGVLIAAGGWYATQGSRKPKVEPAPKPKVDPNAHEKRLKLVANLARANMKLATKPEAARVFVNGRLVKGVTPGDFPIVAGATNELLLFAPDRLVRRVVGPASALTEGPLTIPLDRKRGVPLVTLTVASPKEGAKVYHNGMFVGTVPVKLRDVAANDLQHIQIQHEATLPVMGVFEFEATGQNDISVTLTELKEAREEVDVQFDVTPRGAEVLVDGKVVCKSPCTHTVKRGPRVDVEFKKEGFRPSKHVLELHRESRFIYREQLDALDVKMGEVTVEAKGFKRVLIDGADYGEPPVRRAKLKVGQHYMTLRDEAGEQFKANIKIKEDRKLTAKVSMRKKGVLRVRRSYR